MKAKIRVLHVITSLGKGGAETMLHNFLRAHDRSGFAHQVISLTPHGFFAPLIRSQGVPVLELNLRRPAALLRSLRQASAAVRGFRPDIIHGWMYHGNIFAHLLCGPSLNRRPVLWNVRHSLQAFSQEPFFTRLVIRLNRLLSCLAAGCVFNSRLSLNQHRAFGFAARVMTAIPNGFDTDRFRPDPAARADRRSRLGLAENEFVIGLVGRNHPLKDYGTFIAAAARLGPLTSPSWRCLMIGKGLQPADPGLATMIVNHRLDGRIIRLDESDDIPALMNAFDCLCLSSASEAFPNVLGEAMATGLPCVTTNAGDAADIVGETGMVVPPRNPAALAEGLARMMALPASRRAVLGQKARRRIQLSFSIGAVAAKYEALYRQTAASGGDRLLR